MSLLIRRRGGAWQRLKPASYSSEAHLQQMLYDSPELIPIPGGDQMGRVFIREAGLPGSGNTDLLGVDSEGYVYVVECKLAANREVRRQVIGQVLEYAAFLWGMSLEEFDGLFVGKEGKSLAELLEGKVPPDWSFDLFSEKIVEHLSSGTFHLIVVVDEINNELEQIIRYFSRSGTGIQLEVLELKLYGEVDTEVLVPELRGRVAEATKPFSNRKLSLKEVLKRCENDAARARLQQLVEEWGKLGNLAEPQTSGISFRAQIDGRTRHIFWAQNPNVITVVFRRLHQQGVPTDIVENYRKQVAEVPGFDRQKVLAQRAPRARLAEMSGDAIRAPIRVNQALVDQWRKALVA